MNQNNQKIAIAEALGWKRVDPPSWRRIKRTINWLRGDQRVYDVPNYPNDANCWPEMWEALSEEEKSNVTNSAVRCSESFEEGCLILLSMTQPQRAELFLRVKNLWKE